MHFAITHVLLQPRNMADSEKKSAVDGAGISKKYR